MLQASESHRSWQSATVLLGVGGVLEHLWETLFPELSRDSRKTHDYRRIVLLIHAGFCAGDLPTVLKFKDVLEEELKLSPNRVEQRLSALVKLGLIEKVRDRRNKRQKRLRPSHDTLKRLMRMGDEWAHYLRHVVVELLPARGTLPPKRPSIEMFDPLPRFNVAALVN